MLGARVWPPLLSGHAMPIRHLYPRARAAHRMPTVPSGGNPSRPAGSAPAWGVRLSYRRPGPLRGVVFLDKRDARVLCRRMMCRRWHLTDHPRPNTGCACSRGLEPLPGVRHGHPLWATRATVPARESGGAAGLGCAVGFWCRRVTGIEQRENGVRQRLEFPANPALSPYPPPLPTQPSRPHTPAPYV